MKVKVKVLYLVLYFAIAFIDSPYAYSSTEGEEGRVDSKQGQASKTGKHTPKYKTFEQVVESVDSKNFNDFSKKISFLESEFAIYLNFINQSCFLSSKKDETSPKAASKEELRLCRRELILAQKKYITKSYDYKELSIKENKSLGLKLINKLSNELKLLEKDNLKELEYLLKKAQI